MFESSVSVGMSYSIELWFTSYFEASGGALTCEMCCLSVFVWSDMTGFSSTSSSSSAEDF